MEAKVSQIPEEENRHVQAKLVLGQENKDIYLQPYRGKNTNIKTRIMTFN